jgi:hypothetical protein
LTDVQILVTGGAPAGDTLTFAITDLTRDDGWPEAVDGCDFVLHVASPYPPDEPGMRTTRSCRRATAP